MRWHCHLCGHVSHDRHTASNIEGRGQKVHKPVSWTWVTGLTGKCSTSHSIVPCKEKYPKRISKECLREACRIYLICWVGCMLTGGLLEGLLGAECDETAGKAMDLRLETNLGCPVAVACSGYYAVAILEQMRTPHPRTSSSDILYFDSSCVRNAPPRSLTLFFILLTKACAIVATSGEGSWANCCSVFHTFAYTFP